MIKNFLLVVILLPIAISCSLFEEEEPAGLKTPTELHTLNDSLISISEEWVIDKNGGTTIVSPISIELTDNFIYIFDRSPLGSIKRFSYDGNFIDSLTDVRAFYTFNNFIYKISSNEINKYTEDFALVSTKYTSSDLYFTGVFSVGDDKSSIVTRNGDLARYDYLDNSVTPIGTTGTGPLEFSSTFLYINKNNDLYYVMENGSTRVQLINSDGTYSSEFSVDTSIMFNQGGLDRIALNDSYTFMYDASGGSSQIQMFNKSNMTYIGFMDLGDIFKSCIAVTNDKIYVVSDYPTSKIIVLDIL